MNMTIERYVSQNVSIRVVGCVEGSPSNSSISVRSNNAIDRAPRKISVPMDDEFTKLRGALSIRNIPEYPGYFYATRTD
jgi:hypothetical protein